LLSAVGVCDYRLRRLSAGRAAFAMSGLSLYGHLRNYLARDIYPFHMPGHKRNPVFMPPDLQALDVTEFGSMDNLHTPDGVIKEVQEKISRIYGSDESFMLVNGSSCGIVAAICATCDEDTMLYAPRDCHQSVFHGMVLSGSKPEYRDMEKAGVVIVACPSYEGRVLDIKALAERIHKRGGILIVDEAHGAHFPFHRAFPQPAILQGADIVINSFHKTLPAFSQTAALHVMGERVDREKLRFYLRVTQTSSPSYIFMAATDFMLDKLTDEPWHFESYVDELKRLRASLPGVTDKQPLTLYSHPDYEIGKLLFTLQTEINSKEIDKRMADEHRVQLEMSSEYSLLAMTSVADTREGFYRLERAVDELNKQLPYRERAALREAAIREVDPSVIALTPSQAMKREAETIPLTEAAGRIAAELVTEYPPGIPLLAPGEIITVEIIKRIRKNTIKVIR
jgi:arginine/lysine/ornithine decarboxylase